MKMEDGGKHYDSARLGTISMLRRSKLVKFPLFMRDYQLCELGLQSLSLLSCKSFFSILFVYFGQLFFKKIVKWKCRPDAFVSKGFHFNECDFDVRQTRLSLLLSCISLSSYHFRNLFFIRYCEKNMVQTFETVFLVMVPRLAFILDKGSEFQSEKKHSGWFIYRNYSKKLFLKKINSNSTKINILWIE